MDNVSSVLLTYVVPSPPRYALGIYIVLRAFVFVVHAGFSIPAALLFDLHRVRPSCALALSALDGTIPRKESAHAYINNRDSNPSAITRKDDSLPLTYGQTQYSPHTTGGKNTWGKAACKYVPARGLLIYQYLLNTRAVWAFTWHEYTQAYR